MLSFIECIIDSTTDLKSDYFYVEAMIQILNCCNLDSTLDRIKNEKEKGTSESINNFV
jgi:hypothetical protein